MTRLLIEMANNFNLAMDEGDIEKILEAVPEELTIELLELEEKHIAKEEVRGNKEKEPPRKFTVKGLREAFEDLGNLLKKFENMDINNKMFSLRKEYL